MSSILRSILLAVVGRSIRTDATIRRHHVRRHTRGKPRGGATVVREYRRRNRG